MKLKQLCMITPTPFEHEGKMDKEWQHVIRKDTSHPRTMIYSNHVRYPGAASMELFLK